MSDEYRVKISIRNNLLLSAIENAGYKSLTHFSKEIGCSLNQLIQLVNLKIPPIKCNGEFSEIAKKAMEALGAAPFELWTDAQLTMRLSSNAMHHAISEKNVRAILEDHINAMTLEDQFDGFARKEICKILQNTTNNLPERYIDIINKRFYDEKTLEETAKNLSVSPSRIRQIEQKALRMLRRKLSLNYESGDLL